MKHWSFLALLLLASCGGPSAPTPQTLTVDCYTNVSDAVQAVIPLFKKQHPGVNITLNALNYGDHHNKLTTAFTSGQGAGDVACIEVGFVDLFGRSGGLDDLTQAPFDAERHQGKLTAYAWAQGVSSGQKRFVVPVDVAPGTLFYRTDLLTQAGVQVTELSTWEGFLTAGQKIKEKTGAHLLHHARFMAQAYIRANIPEGESLYFDAKGTPVLNSPRFVQALTLARKARDLKLDMNVSEWSLEWNQALSKGQLATQMWGSWFEGTMRGIVPETAGKWRAADLPGSGYATWGGSFMGIPRQSKNKALAWEFVQFMLLNPEAQLTAFKASGALPVLKSVQTDAVFQEGLPFLGGQKAYPLWLNAANNIKAIAGTSRDGVASNAFHAAIHQVLNEGVDVQTALNAAQKVVMGQ